MVLLYRLLPSSLPLSSSQSLWSLASRLPPIIVVSIHFVSIEVVTVVTVDVSIVVAVVLAAVSVCVGRVAGLCRSRLTTRREIDEIPCNKSPKGFLVISLNGNVVFVGFQRHLVEEKKKKKKKE